MFLSEFSGVVTTLSLALFGIKVFYNFLSVSYFGLVIFFLLIFIASIASIKWIKTKTKNINSKIRKDEIENDLQTYSKQSGNILISNLLPSNDLLSRWLDEAKEKTTTWSDDVKISIINFYIHVNNNVIKPQLQVYFMSDWNKESMVVYIGKNTSHNYSESEYDLFKTKIGITIPFYKKYPRWNFATQKAYLMMKNKLPPIFSIQLYQDSDYFQIKFDFTQGKVEKSEKFSYDGSTLCNIKTSQRTTIN